MEATPPPARRRNWKAIVLLVTALALLIADQVTKALVVADLAVGQKVNLIGDAVQIWHAQNRGAAFSLLQDSQLLKLGSAKPFLFLVMIEILKILKS